MVQFKNNLQEMLQFQVLQEQHLHNFVLEQVESIMI